MNGSLEIMNRGTAFDGNWKDSFVCITQDPAPQPDLVGLGHIPWAWWIEASVSTNMLKLTGVCKYLDLLLEIVTGSWFARICKLKVYTMKFDEIVNWHCKCARRAGPRSSPRYSLEALLAIRFLQLWVFPITRSDTIAARISKAYRDKVHFLRFPERRTLPDFPE